VQRSNLLYCTFQRLITRIVLWQKVGRSKSQPVKSFRHDGCQNSVFGWHLVEIVFIMNTSVQKINTVLNPPYLFIHRLSPYYLLQLCLYFGITSCYALLSNQLKYTRLVQTQLLCELLNCQLFNHVRRKTRGSTIPVRSDV
jgi:hypothetical protein